ncbi:hypothetical protein ABMA27_010757 [Loxostege sticticalis]|uniref:Peptidase S1 domain-containing protein n=1 Tax=Loxostege sticticalis TaxID=481309 RepID=A0ABR3H491_LOXSC
MADLNLVDSRIIGGSNTVIENYPFLVQLERDGTQSCGGALLTRRHVLTAAHCFFDNNGNRVAASRLRVRVGTTRRGRDGSTRRVSTYVIHSGYNNRTMDSDIAIIVMASSVTLGSRVGRVRIPLQGQTVPSTAPLVYVGWGSIVETNSVPSSVLQMVQVQKVNFTVCAENYRNVPAPNGPIYLTSNMICAGRLGVGGADACQGDSGGPLLQGNTAVGVVSFGLGCGRAQYPGINVRVSAFSNWINATVTQFNGSSAPIGSAVLLITCFLASLALMVKEV